MTDERADTWKCRMAIIEGLVAEFAARGQWSAAQRAMRLSRQAYDQRAAELASQAGVAQPKGSCAPARMQPANENRYAPELSAAIRAPARRKADAHVT